MKKLLIFVFVTVLFMFQAGFEAAGNKLINEKHINFDNLSYSHIVYLNNDRQNKDSLKKQGILALENGNKLFAEIKQDNYSDFLQTNTSTVGHMWKFEDASINEVVLQFKNKLSASVKKVEQVNDMFFVYMHTSKLEKNAVLQNKVVNLQIVQANGYVLAGYPMILHSF